MLNFIAPIYGDGSIEYQVLNEIRGDNLFSILLAIKSYFLQNPQALIVVGMGFLKCFCNDEKCFILSHKNGIVMLMSPRGSSLLVTLVVVEYEL